MRDQLLKIYLQFGRVSTDTRNIREGDIFFALKGGNFNGNAYAERALENGASYVVIDEKAYFHKEDPRYILVKDGLQALQQLARDYRRQFHIPVLGLTGSNGKTTTKELIASALATQFRVHATQGNFNNHIGVPLTLLAMPRDTEIAIVEMGTNQPGDIAELVDIAQPTHGMITNIGKAHLERLKSLEGVKKEKGALFDFIRKQEGTVFVNADDFRVLAAAEGIAHQISFGLGNADVRGEVQKRDLQGMEIEVCHKDWPRPEVFRTHLSGHHNMLNVLAALAIGQEFGLSIGDMKAGISAYQARNNRSQLIKAGPYTIWMDAYNANPSSMRATIENLFEVHPEGTAVILGDMLELGVDEKAEHAGIGRLLNTYQPSMVIGIGPLMQDMVFAYDGNKAWFPEVEAAREELPGLLDGSKVILMKGSRGMALERLLPFLK